MTLSLCSLRLVPLGVVASLIACQPSAPTATSSPDSGEPTNPAPSGSPGLVIGVANYDLVSAATPCVAASGGEGRIAGTASRAMTTQEDGIGTLLISVLDVESGPGGRLAACEVASARYERLDLSDEETSHRFEITGLPTRPEPYHVVAIFDDSGDLAADRGPVLGNGDLVNSVGEELSFPTVVVRDSSPAQLDLSLGFVFAVPVGGHEIEGTWRVALDSGEQAELKAAQEALSRNGEDAAASTRVDELTAKLTSIELQVGADELRVIRGSVTEVFSYAIESVDGKTVVTTTSSAGEVASSGVSWDADEVMTWSGRLGSSADEVTLWRRP